MADDALAVNHYSADNRLEKGRFLRFQHSQLDPIDTSAISSPTRLKKTCKFKAIAVADITCSEVSRLLTAALLKAKAN